MNKKISFKCGEVYCAVPNSGNFFRILDIRHPPTDLFIFFLKNSTAGKVWTHIQHSKHICLLICFLNDQTLQNVDSLKHMNIPNHMHNVNQLSQGSSTVAFCDFLCWCISVKSDLSLVGCISNDVPPHHLVARKNKSFKQRLLTQDFPTTNWFMVERKQSIWKHMFSRFLGNCSVGDVGRRNGQR